MAHSRSSADAPASRLPNSRSWRDIRQGVNPRAMSRAGRRRRAVAGVKIGAVIAAVVIVVGGAFAIRALWRNDPARLKEPVKAIPLKQVVFSTDGVLGAAWVGETLALPQKSSLMTLDLHALEHRLLASGQVLGVTLRRRFTDDSLVVTLHERKPVARLMAQTGDAPARMLLVAADGVVFRNVGYAAADLDQLPWLDGFVLRRSPERGFEPVSGMDQVAGLLSAARALVPRLYTGWQVVSLARLASDKEILVRSHDIPEIVFDAGAGFPRQLEKLDYIVDALRTHGAPPVARVDLAVGSQVPVELEAAASDQAPRAPPGPAQFQPKLRRDF